MLTLLAVGTKGSDHAGDSFLFNSSLWVGDASLFLDFLEERELNLSSEEAHRESPDGVFSEIETVALGISP